MVSKGARRVALGVAYERLEAACVEEEDDAVRKILDNITQAMYRRWIRAGGGYLTNPTFFGSRIVG